MRRKYSKYKNLKNDQSLNKSSIEGINQTHEKSPTTMLSFDKMMDQFDPKMTSNEGTN